MTRELISNLEWFSGAMGQDFLYQIFIWKEDGLYYYAEMRDHGMKFDKVPAPPGGSLDLGAIFYFPLPPKTTVAPYPLPKDSFVRGPELWVAKYHRIPADAVSEFLTMTAKEISLLEILKETPHPNLAEYLGCVRDGESGLGAGLCFKRYECTLYEAVIGNKPFNSEAILEGVTRGIEHLNSLGWVYGNIHPTSVMLASDGTPVVNRLYASLKEGTETIFLKKDPVDGFLKLHHHTASTQDDTKALEEFRKWLQHRKVGFVLIVTDSSDFFDQVESVISFGTCVVC